MQQSLDLKLDRAYGASNPESLQKVYSTWAKDYDADLARMGYRFPSLASAVLARHCLNRQTPILDAGAGTGLVGTWLHDLGYRNLTALDFSEEMLQETRKRGIYLRIEWGDMEARLPFDDESFEAVIAVGVFTQGHVSPAGLDEIQRVCYTEGTIVIPFMENTWEKLGFKEKVQKMENSGKWKRLEQTPWAPVMPFSADHKNDLGAVFVWHLN